MIGIKSLFNGVHRSPFLFLGNKSLTEIPKELQISLTEQPRKQCIRILPSLPSETESDGVRSSCAGQLIKNPLPYTLCCWFVLPVMRVANSSIVIGAVHCL